jgi:hypothetical protein
MTADKRLQEFLGRINSLLCFYTTRTAEKTNEVRGHGHADGSLANKREHTDSKAIQ